MVKQGEKIIEIIAEVEDVRLDAFLATLPDIPSRSFAEKLIIEEKVTVDGRLRDKSYRLKPGQKVRVVIPPEKETGLEPYHIPIKIVYEDEHLLVVSKPSGLVVHPSHGHKNDTLVNALIAHGVKLSSLGGLTRPGIVHRLDKDTSGLMLVAKTNEAHLFLAGRIRERKVKRQYLTLACGNIYRSRFEVRAPITRHRQDFSRMTVDFNRGKIAYTYFDVIKVYNGFTYLKATLGTGRTHQIRVHLATIGHPVAGDPIYGGLKCARPLPLKRLFLHATAIEFEHPVTRKIMTFTEPLPQELQEVIDFLEKQEK